MPRYTPGTAAHYARRRRQIAALERAEYIGEKTDDGAEVVDYFLNLMRDAVADGTRRDNAAKWLNENGHAGKPGSTIEVFAADRPNDEVDMSRLSLDETLALERLLVKAATPQLEAADEADDAEVVQ